MIDQPSNSPTYHVRNAHWEALDAAVKNVLRQRPSTPLAPQSSMAPAVQTVTEHHLQSVPIYKIISDHGRYADLDAIMHTRNASPSASVLEKGKRRSDDTPISLYQVGDTYLVRDGNVRVARAHARGQVFLPAHVSEYIFRSPQSPTQARDLILHEERRAFMHATGLPLNQEHTLTCTALGSYDQLMLHIKSCQNELVAEEASLVTLAAVWYNRVYKPIYSLFRRHSIADSLANRSVADVYLWAMDYRLRAFGAWNQVSGTHNNRLHVRVSAALRDAAELLRIARTNARERV